MRPVGYLPELYEDARSEKKNIYIEKMKFIKIRQKVYSVTLDNERTKQALYILV